MPVNFKQHYANLSGLKADEIPRRLIPASIRLFFNAFFSSFSCTVFAQPAAFTQLKIAQ